MGSARTASARPERLTGFLLGETGWRGTARAPVTGARALRVTTASRLAASRTAAVVAGPRHRQSPRGPASAGPLRRTHARHHLAPASPAPGRPGRRVLLALAAAGLTGPSAAASGLALAAPGRPRAAAPGRRGDGGGGQLRRAHVTRRPVLRRTAQVQESRGPAARGSRPARRGRDGLARPRHRDPARRVVRLGFLTAPSSARPTTSRSASCATTSTASGSTRRPRQPAAQRHRHQRHHPRLLGAGGRRHRRLRQRAARRRRRPWSSDLGAGRPGGRPRRTREPHRPGPLGREAARRSGQRRPGRDSDAARRHHRGAGVVPHAGAPAPGLGDLHQPRRRRGLPARDRRRDRTHPLPAQHGGLRARPPPPWCTRTTPARAARSGGAPSTSSTSSGSATCRAAPPGCAVRAPRCGPT